MFFHPFIGMVNFLTSAYDTENVGFFCNYESKKLGVFPRLSENKITFVKVFVLEVWKERSIKILIPFGEFWPSLLDF